MGLLPRAAWCAHPAETPGVIGVMPFQNCTSDQDISRLVRASFYSHLTIRPYKDVELGEVDKALHTLGLRTINSANKEAVKTVGRMLGLDYVVFGRVKAKERLYLAIYSRASLFVEIVVVDTHSGREIWRDSYVASSHGGGIPLSPLSVPLISIFSGLNLRNSVVLNMVEEACRTLAYRVPLFQGAVNGQKTRDNILSYAVQLGAFSERARAVKLLRLMRSRGYPAYMSEQGKGPSSTLYRLMLGPYESRQEAERMKREISKEIGIMPIIRPINGGRVQG